MTLAGPILVTMVVGVALFLVPGLLSPETKGKVLAGELRNLGKKPAVSDRDIIVLGRIGAHGLGVKQLTLATVGFERYRKTTRRAVFLHR